MVKHIIMWDFPEGMGEQERKESAKRIKEALEGLKGKIDGIIEMRVVIDPLASSTADVLLDSVFESVEALEAYKPHPEHQKAASIVRSILTNRRCVDYQI